MEPGSLQMSLPVPISLLTWALHLRRPLYTRPKEPSPITSRARAGHCSSPLPAWVVGLR